MIVGLACTGVLKIRFRDWRRISQQPRAFDFPRRGLPETFHYTGPLRGLPTRKIDFPWHLLDGRPIVYASLGTLQHSKKEVFRCFATACEGLDVQLVIAHNGGLEHDAIALLPGKPVTVRYAPQTEVLARSVLALTHAGLNTVLDALTYGVPIVAVPIAYEQPAIAARVEYCGAGCFHSPFEVASEPPAECYRRRAGAKKICFERGENRGFNS